MKEKPLKLLLYVQKKCTVKLMRKFQLSQQKRIFRAEAIFCTKLQLLYARNVSPLSPEIDRCVLNLKLSREALFLDILEVLSAIRGYYRGLSQRWSIRTDN